MHPLISSEPESVKGYEEPEDEQTLLLDKSLIVTVLLVMRILMVAAGIALLSRRCYPHEMN